MVTTRDIARVVPKTELHLHLDGSLPESFIHRRATARCIECPEQEHEIRLLLHEMKAAARVRDPNNAQRKGGNWGVFDFCNQFLQRAEELEEAAAAIVVRCAVLEVRVVELRFCPALHVLEGLTAAAAVEAVIRGIERALSPAQRGGVIVCGLRSHEREAVLEMAQLCTRFRRETGVGVVGFDLAGDEGSYPLRLHRDAIEYCVAEGVPVTVHAGEWPGTSANVALALECGVTRIGHGWGMATDPELMARVAASNVLVEVCLTSNVKPGAGRGWLESYGAHPVRAMYDAGVCIALSSDNMTLSGDAERAADAEAELVRLVDLCGFSWAEARQILLNGVRGAFCVPTAERDDFVGEFERALDAVLASAGAFSRPKA